MDSAHEERGIVVEISGESPVADLDRGKIEALVLAVCERFGLSRATIGVAVVDDSGFRVLNRRFLHREGTSDCLSFDLSEDGAGCPKHFEVVVNGELAVSEASARGHSSGSELALYITHGLLHNLGFDDSTSAEAARMHETEDGILHQLGYGLVYNTDDG